MDPSVVMIVSNDVIKLVFKEVLKNRRINFKDLRESLTKTPEMQASLRKDPELEGAFSKLDGSGLEPDAEKHIGDVAEKQIESAVQQLKNAKLVEERSAPIKDFSTIYVTENGLNAARDLRQAATM